jgi:hypothetical protein
MLALNLARKWGHEVFICDKKKAIEANKGPERQNGEVV